MKFTQRKIIVLAAFLVIAVCSIVWAGSSSQMVQDYGQTKVQCFAPRGPLTFTSTTTNVTGYLAVKFYADATVTITWKDDTTTVVAVTAGETWAIDDKHIKSIATAASTAALWM